MPWRLFCVQDFLPFNDGLLELDEDGGPVGKPLDWRTMGCHTSRLVKT
jgi:hypothetical protein